MRKGVGKAMEKPNVSYDRAYVCATDTIVTAVTETQAFVSDDRVCANDTKLYLGGFWVLTNPKT